MNIDQAIESMDIYERKSKHFYDLGYTIEDHLKKQKAFRIAHKYNQRVSKIARMLEFVFNRAEQEENWKQAQKDGVGIIGSRFRLIP
jgi:hypothetical protein